MFIFLFSFVVVVGFSNGKEQSYRAAPLARLVLIRQSFFASLQVEQDVVTKIM
jgi:hypothetical protein